MEQEKLVQGWMVCGTDEEAQKPEMYFLDVNNAIAYREMQRDAASLTIRLQYIRPEWAKDFHKSRLRQPTRLQSTASQSHCTGTGRSSFLLQKPSGRSP